jgi:preprotein translocase subunit SecY
MFEGQSSHLPLKLNTSGVIPPIFASSLLLLPTTVANFNAGRGRMADAGSPRSSATAGRCSWRSMSALIVFFAFFYTAIVFNPTETADNLKKHGGFIPGHPAGRAHRRVHRLRAVADHGDRRGLSGGRLPDSRNADFLCLGAVLLSAAPRS